MRRGVTWWLCAALWLSAWGFACAGRSGEHPLQSTRRRRAASNDDVNKKCSYTFLVPQQKIKGPICASATGPEPDKERVTRMDISDLRVVLNRQRREIETLQLVVDVDGNLVNEMKLLRKESRNMN